VAYSLFFPEHLVLIDRYDYEVIVNRDFCPNYNYYYTVSLLQFMSKNQPKVNLRLPLFISKE
jgi:hypothetical protein